MLSQRIKIFIHEHLQISTAKFEISIGSSVGTIGKAIRSNTDIQSKWVVSTLKTYPELNAYWLLLGEEPMLKDGTISPYQEPLPITEILHVKLNSFEKEIESLKKEVELKDEIISLLKKQQS